MENWIMPAGILLLLWNGAVLLLYGLDKVRAKKGQRRISERTLLLCAALFGGLGGLLGMYLCRHKTKHVQFQILVPLFLAIQIGLIVFFLL